MIVLKKDDRMYIGFSLPLLVKTAEYTVSPKSLLLKENLPIWKVRENTLMAGWPTILGNDIIRYSKDIITKDLDLKNDKILFPIANYCCKIQKIYNILDGENEKNPKEVYQFYFILEEDIGYFIKNGEFEKIKDCNGIPSLLEYYRIINEFEPNLTVEELIIKANKLYEDKYNIIMYPFVYTDTKDMVVKMIERNGKIKRLYKL